MNFKYCSIYVSGEPRSLYEHIADLPMLLRHLWRYFWSGEGIQILFRLRILTLLGLAVFYVLLPFDLVPEVVFGVFGKKYFCIIRFVYKLQKHI